MSSLLLESVSTSVSHGMTGRRKKGKTLLSDKLKKRILVGLGRNFLHLIVRSVNEFLDVITTTILHRQETTSRSRLTWLEETQEDVWFEEGWGPENVDTEKGHGSYNDTLRFTSPFVEVDRVWWKDGTPRGRTKYQRCKVGSSLLNEKKTSVPRGMPPYRRKGV